MLTVECSVQLRQRAIGHLPRPSQVSFIEGCGNQTIYPLVQTQPKYYCALDDVVTTVASGSSVLLNCSYP